MTSSSFEAGSGLWHARIRRADISPLVINGMPFPRSKSASPGSDPDAAIADAKHHIDRFKHRWADDSDRRISADCQRPRQRA